MTRALAIRIALTTVAATTVVGVWQWNAAIPVLVEIAIPPTPLVSFYPANLTSSAQFERLSGMASSSYVTSFLDRRFGLQPGNLELVPGAQDVRWQATSVVGRAWLPTIGFQVWQARLSNASGVRGVFDNPKISFEDPNENGCGAPNEATESEIRGELGGGNRNAPESGGKGVLIALADDGIDLEALSERRGVAIDPKLSWPENREPGPSGHGTEMAFDATIAAPQATLADIQLSTELKMRLDQLEMALPELILRLQQGQGRDYTGIVLLNSWTMDNATQSGDPGTYSDDPNHPVTRLFANLTAMNVDVVFAAGNTGCGNPPSTGTIFGAASHEATLTLAAVDIKKNLIPLSSNGPGRKTMSGEKPDLSSFAGFVRDDGTKAIGTSTAAAVAAGFLAALQSTPEFHADVVSPAAFKKLLLNAADRHVIDGGVPLELRGHHNRFGFGVIRSPLD